MRKKYIERHFVSHIAEHIVGAFFVLGVAVGAAYLSSDVSAQTLTMPPLDSTQSGASLPAGEPAVETNTASPVFFAVTPAPVTDCSGSQPMNMVLFALAPLSGGTFVVTSNSGTADMKLSWGEYPLPNGTYIWRGIPNSGFVSMEGDTGTFELKGVCSTGGGGTASVTTNVVEETNTTKEAAETTLLVDIPPLQTTSFVPTILSRPDLKIFSDNVPVTSATHVFDKEDIEFRLSGSGVKKITLTAIAKDTGKAMQIGSAIIDDLLSTKSTDIWVYFWNVKNIPVGSYQVSAKVLRLDGTTIDAFPVSITIDHKEGAVQSEVSEDTNTEHGDGVVTTHLSVTLPEKEEILARVSEPSACTTVLECETFCASKASDVCTSYVQRVVSPYEESAHSLAEGVSLERVSLMLKDPKRRPQELPETVVSREEFSAYCSELANEEVCTKALVRNDLATPESLIVKKAALLREAEEQKSIFSERIGAREFIDSDMDSITDYDEVNIYHTDPKNRDTDHDGFVDGTEVLAHTSPRGGRDASRRISSEDSTVDDDQPADEEVQLENPLISGPTDSTLLAVATVGALSVGLDDEGNATVKKLRLSGVSPPNSFVTLFVYSDPIVAVVKADASGAWVYTLDRELPDGTHHVISAITDGGGRILAKSEPLPFVKEAAAVSVGAALSPNTTGAPSFFGDASLYGVAAIIIALLGISFSVLGFVVYHKKEDDLNIHHI